MQGVPNTGDHSVMGYLVLQGGSEFGGHMAVSDRRALTLAGGMNARVSIIPAAAAPDANHHQAGKRGCDWFHELGARHVESTPIVDRSSANDPELAERLARSGLIYLLGGFPDYLAQTLANTYAWRAIKTALGQRAVVAGSSAGAMVLCDRLFDPTHHQIVDGLGALKGCCVLPHHNKFGRQWAPFLEKKLPDATLIGIDEQTGVVNDGAQGRWTVYGGGTVTLYRNRKAEHYAAGAIFTIH